MTAEEFREKALSMPDTVEGAHWGHADFRVHGRIFASLGYPDSAWAMVKLAPDQQAELIAAKPMVFGPAPGAWGKRGSTQVRLTALDVATAANAIRLAWEAAAFR